MPVAIVTNLCKKGGGVDFVQGSAHVLPYVPYTKAAPYLPS